MCYINKIDLTSLWCWNKIFWVEFWIRPLFSLFVYFNCVSLLCFLILDFSTVHCDWNNDRPGWSLPFVMPCECSDDLLANVRLLCCNLTCVCFSVGILCVHEHCWRPLCHHGHCAVRCRSGKCPSSVGVWQQQEQCLSHTRQLRAHGAVCPGKNNKNLKRNAGVTILNSNFIFVFLTSVWSNRLDCYK